MIFTPTTLEGSWLIELQPRKDSRGWFARAYCREEFEKAGLRTDWVQANHSYTVQQGSIRGLHFQHPPHAEIKLVRCIAGSVFDVIVDIRHNSPTFLQWFGVTLSAENQSMLYIPQGFAHGFQSLTPHSELLYQVSAYYAPQAEAGLRFDDPRLNIHWPLPLADISEKDRQHSLLSADFSGLKI